MQFGNRVRQSGVAVRLPSGVVTVLAALWLALPARLVAQDADRGPAAVPASPATSRPDQPSPSPQAPPEQAPAPLGAASAKAGGTGIITGHVRGPNGVSIPGASVDLIEEQTGERKETWTDEAGNYTLSGVQPGTYKLEVSLLGFRTDVRQPVPVSAGNPLKVNLALVIAKPEESASASGPGGARAAGLASLPPAVQDRIRSMMAQGGGDRGGGGGLAEGGLEGADNSGQGSGGLRFSNSTGADQGENSSPDEGAESGASAATSFLLAGGVSQAPTPGDQEGGMRQRIQEFRESQQGAPGFGGGGGGFGGGGGLFFFGGPGGGGRRGARVNRLRGNISERWSNSALDAHPYPLNVASSPQVPSYSEQLGINLGGPLVIPKVYNGSDKTSFFASYNLQRNHNPFDTYATVPTALERTGDFSQTVIPSGPFAGTVPTLYDPESSAQGPRTAFANNQIPPSRFDPAAVALLGYIPAPNLPGGVQNFRLLESLPSDNDRLMFRIGHQINSKDSVNVFYYFNSTRSQSVSSFPELTSHSSGRGQNVNLGESHTFNPHVVNNLMFNFNRQRTETLNPFAFKQNIAAALGIEGVSENPFDWGIPVISYTNFSGLNDVIPSLVRNQTVRGVDTVIWNRGKHNVRLGGEVRRVELNTLNDPNARGTFTFTGFTTSDFTASGQPMPGTGFDFADFLLGLPQTTAVRFGTSSNYLRSWVYSGYAQDDWRASTHLTFNAGLRYEYFQPFVEKYGHLSDLALGSGFSTVGVVTGQSPGGLPPSLIRGAPANLAPRIGIAYRPWIEHHLVVRAGFGIFYDGSIYNRLTTGNLTDQPPFASASTLVTSPAAMLTLEQGFPVIDPRVAHNTYAVDPNFHTPYGETWNLHVEDPIVRNVILSVGYVGTRGNHLDLRLAPATAFSGEAGGATTGAQALPYIYETSGASSAYNALQVVLRRQFHGGFSISGNYTYSKSIDDASSVGGAGNIVAQNFLDLAAERGLSTFDMRHNFRLNYLYELPFGERHRFLSRGGAAAKILGDWQISGIGTLQSGLPFSASVLGNQANNTGSGPFFAQRPDATGLPVSLAASQRNTLEFFNTAAFALPQAGAFGDAGRDTIPGPSNISFNMSLDRHITFSQEKGVRLDFRIEAQNIFNTPHFTSLGTVINAVNFGRVTGVGSMRTADISLRLRF